MVHAYNQMYLYDAMLNLAEAFDVAVNGYNFTLNFFMQLFINSGIAHQFEVGNPRYLVGKSGTELVDTVVTKVYGIDGRKEVDTSYTPPTVEYWTGWVLAYYQWSSGKSFRDIQKIITVEELSKKYNPYHEMDEEKIVEYINSKAEHADTVRRLQAYRKLYGMSQSELAREAGINLRTLQQYEIGAKDINKAAASTVLSLSKVLKCRPEDLCGE
ncbi:helix-turn-helix domain-containing protein [Pseudobutyrivibrio xylanivorans]|uniref:Helix-turn-helix transcriptional regulator n=1 Tax=Pseudobutyrivibrio xylanivorans TaxID=185007 RepID=A0A5P6VVS2_PSEXY|nr:helix-turn-helix transcriptional regulator [Pseudobutyrivibrio xylanivorans]QFJ55381.1 helix-turn-helix transcriptional regulator [Pseudobutyrivibrio xylanivorans]